MEKSTPILSKKVLDAFCLFVGTKNGFQVDENVKRLVCILTEIFLRYFIVTTIDLMPINKTFIEYDDLHRAVVSDKRCLFLAGAFNPKITLDIIQQRKHDQIIELD